MRDLADNGQVRMGGCGHFIPALPIKFDVAYDESLQVLAGTHERQELVKGNYRCGPHQGVRGLRDEALFSIGSVGTVWGDPPDEHACEGDMTQIWRAFLWYLRIIPCERKVQHC